MDARPVDDLKGGRVKNRRRLVEMLRQNGALTLASLVDQTGLSRATVSSLVSELRQHDIVVNEEPRAGAARAGRPPSMVALAGSVGVGVGIKVSPDEIQVAIGNVGLDVVVEEARRPTDFEIGADPDAALRLSAEMVKEALDAAGLRRSQVIGGALALPAAIDSTHARVAPSTGLPAWNELTPAATLTSLVGFPVLIGNDANLAAFAEAVAGAVVGAADVLYIKADAFGVGCGLIINGRLYPGAYGGAGEIAHMVVEPGGALCFCRTRGCLGMVVLGQSMVEEVRNGHLRQLTRPEFNPHALEAPDLGVDQQLDLVVRWALAGDPISSRVLGEAGSKLGVAVGSACNMLNPGRVVVGGTLIGAGEIFMDPFKRAVRDHTSVLPGGPVQIVSSHFDERADLMGAVALAIRGEYEPLTKRLCWLVEKALLDEVPTPSASP